MIFTGIKDYSVDEKGRVVLPPKYRDALEGDLMIFKDIRDKCINIYPYDEYEKYIKTLYDEDIMDSDTRLILDRVIGRAEVVQMDKQGRIMIPQKMRDAVGINKDVIVKGSMTKFEIWTQEEYSSTFDDDEAVRQALDRQIEAKKDLKRRGLK